jgi:anti-sigma-K factor RskA
MSTERTEIDELLPLYALGALESDEMRAVERYLAAHPELEARLRELEEGVAALALAAPAAPLPADARRRLLARARADAATPTRGSERTGAARRSAGAWPRVRWVFVAVALAGLLFWNVQLQRALNAPAAQVAALAGRPDTNVSLLVSTPAAPGAVGRLYLSADGAHGVLAVTGLPAPSAGREYQFWFARPDKSRDSAAVFAVGPQGEALVSVAAPGALDQYDQIWITQEPAGGSAVPTAPHFLEGPLTL